MAKKRTEKNANAPSREAGPGTRSNLAFYLVLGLVAAAGVVWLVFARGSGAPDNLPVGVADMEAEPSGAAGVSTGPADAPVTIIEFEDYRCPSCRQFNSMTGRLLRQNLATGDDAVLRWVSYDFPIFGQDSWYPALAARCAGDQGRFWQMHDLLYARTEDWYGESNPNRAFLDLAEQIGLDGAEFRTCLEERPHLSDIAASRKYGESLGVSGTPALYLNGRPLNESRYQVLESLVLEAARAARAAEGGSGQSGESDTSDTSGAAGG